MPKLKELLLPEGPRKKLPDNLSLHHRSAITAYLDPSQYGFVNVPEEKQNPEYKSLDADIIAFAKVRLKTGQIGEMDMDSVKRRLANTLGGKKQGSQS